MARLCGNTGSYKSWPFKLAYMSGHTGILKTWEFVMKREHVTLVFIFFFFVNMKISPQTPPLKNMVLFLFKGVSDHPHKIDTVICKIDCFSNLVISQY